jgi:UDP-2-acetamido-2,6-beta-L-arabino-hexul-4-ose reductase
LKRWDLIYKFGRDDLDLESKIMKSDFIFHLAGINRTDKENEFHEVNVGLTQRIIEEIKKTKRIIPVLFSSSYQAVESNPYGTSKKIAEDLLINFYKTTSNPLYIFRLPGVFGKWSRPYYNSVVATFILQIHSGSSLTIHNPETEIVIAYIDDVVEEMMRCINLPNNYIYQELKTTYKLKLQELANKLSSFKESEENLLIPQLEDDFKKKLYSTYVSFKPKQSLRKKLQMNVDERGSFTEILKQINFGQFSVNVSKPGIEKGQHYHHHKHEKFLVVKGQAEINLRNIINDDIIKIQVSDKNLELIDIPPGYVHSIKNIGSNELVTLMWANELFNSEKPDTTSKKV